MAIPSPITTKIIALPNAFGSSLHAPIAAGAAFPTAIPAPIQDNPVAKAAPKYLIPSPVDSEMCIRDSSKQETRRTRKTDGSRTENTLDEWERAFAKAEQRWLYGGI